MRDEEMQQCSELSSTLMANQAAFVVLMPRECFARSADLSECRTLCFGHFPPSECFWNGSSLPWWWRRRRRRLCSTSRPYVVATATRVGLSLSLSLSLSLRSFYFSHVLVRVLVCVCVCACLFVCVCVCVCVCSIAD